MLIFRRTHCIHAAYGTVTLYESLWWPVGAQFEWELTKDACFSKIDPYYDTSFLGLTACGFCIPSTWQVCSSPIVFCDYRKLKVNHEGVIQWKNVYIKFCELVNWFKSFTGTLAQTHTYTYTYSTAISVVCLFLI